MNEKKESQSTSIAKGIVIGFLVIAGFMMFIGFINGATGG